MRENKFRFWCEYNKEMYTSENSPEYTIVITPHGFSMVSYDESMYNFQENIKDNSHDGILNIVAMQFTGLKDKNLVDIYEGDIIKCNKQNCIVVFGKKTCGFGYHVKYNTSWNVVDKFYRLSTKDEVIGNIYSNPELLNQ